jgi:hypothetical protein
VRRSKLARLLKVRVRYRRYLRDRDTDLLRDGRTVVRCLDNEGEAWGPRANSAIGNNRKGRERPELFLTRWQGDFSP